MGWIIKFLASSIRIAKECLSMCLRLSTYSATDSPCFVSCHKVDIVYSLRYFQMCFGATPSATRFTSLNVAKADPDRLDSKYDFVKSSPLFVMPFKVISSSKRWNQSQNNSPKEPEKEMGGLIPPNKE